MNAPIWQTNEGFLGTITERTQVVFNLVAENAESFEVISGDLPTGLSIFNDGTISGIPASVGGTIHNQFVVRAANTSGVTDRTFILDSTGLSPLAWVTPGTENTSTAGFLQVGRLKEYYVINYEYVDFQFEASQGEVTVPLSTSTAARKNRIYVSTLTNVDAGQPGVWRIISSAGIQTGTTITSISQTFNVANQGYAVDISLPTTDLVAGSVTLYDPLPFGQKIIYYIGEQEGQLPPGLTLHKDGRLTGYVNDKLSFDSRILTGGYDVESYDGYPYDHGILINGQYVRQVSYFVPKIYQFTVSAYNSINTVKRSFRILVVDPSNLRADSIYTFASGQLSAESSYLITPTWLEPIWFGFTSTIGIIY